MELDAALAQLLAGFDQVFEPFERHQPPDAHDLDRPGVRELVAADRGKFVRSIPL